MYRFLSIFFLFMFVRFFSLPIFAQTAAPTVTFYSVDEGTDMTLSPGDSQTAQAPLDITCTANIDDAGGKYSYICEWRIYNSDQGEDAPLLTRFDEDIHYTLTVSGGYGVKLYVTFVDARNDTTEYESDQIQIVISESKLTCPDGFSPNDDGINDVLHIDYQSIVKLSGAVFNRWGKKLHSFTLQNVDEGWDGKVGGSYVKDGAYLIHIDAVGSDGLHYRIKKVINVLKGYNEVDGSTGEQ